MHWLGRIGRITVAVATVGWGVVMNAAPAAATSAAPPAACFSPPTATGTGAGAFALVAGDFSSHHDGILDVVTANSGLSGFVKGSISMLIGKGDGSFDYIGDVPIPDPPASPAAMVAGDFNRDGKLDLAIAGGPAGLPAEAGASILLGNGNGTFQSAVKYSVADGSNSITAADLDGDGFLDLVTANSGDSVSVLMNKGNGTFNSAVSYPLPNGSGSFIAVGDVNGDGHPDLVATDNYVEVFNGNGDGTFDPTVKTFNPGFVTPPTDGVALADANRDGRLDIFVGGYALLLNTGNVNGYARFNTSPISMGEAARGIAVGDVDGDQIPDIEVGGQTLGGGSPAYGSGVALGNRNGTFEAEVDYDYRALWANLADINGDGRLDILGIDFSNGKLVALLNCTPATPPVPSVPRSRLGHQRTLPPPVPQSGSLGTHSHSLQPRAKVSSNSGASARATLKPIEDLLEEAASRFLSGLLQVI